MFETFLTKYLPFKMWLVKNSVILRDTSQLMSIIKAIFIIEVNNPNYLALERQF